jgi:hypothetical protein
MSREYPDRKEVMTSISNVSSATNILKVYVEAYVTKREERGLSDAWTVEQGKMVGPQMEELEIAQIKLSAHLPKMLAAGDTTAWLVEKSMEANDAAAAYTRQLEHICPELIAEGARVVAAATRSGAAVAPTGKRPKAARGCAVQ